MKIYIVRINSPEIKDELAKNFEKVGEPKSLFKSIIVETDKPREELENFPGVIKVEDDFDIEFAEMNEQEIDNWALPRICGDTKESGFHGEGGTYIYNRTGKNVDIYIADTGIRLDHNEFKDKNGNSRVVTIYPDIENVNEEHISGKDFATSHGTAVASCAAGNICGISKESNIFNVWVLRSGSSVIKGMDRVLYHHMNKPNDNPSIFNMSFGTKSETLLYDETKDLVDNGVICVACAHNYGEPKSTSPAIHSHVVSVGATDYDNTMCGFSNYGETVDFLAPGGYVKLARTKNKDNYTYYGNGTSFSSPYTAGILALIVQNSLIKNEDDVNKAIEILYDSSKKDFIEVRGDTHNRFSYSLVENDIINPKKYKITVNIEGEGEVDPKNIEVERDETVNFTIYPIDGYKLKKIKGVNGTMSNNIFTTDPISEDTEITFVFEKIKYKVTVNIEGEGEVTPKSVEVEHGETAEFEYKPADGYRLKEVKVE